MSGDVLDASPANAGESKTEGPDGNAPVEKPTPKPWPKRRRPKNNYNEAMHFIGQSILYFEKELKTKLTVTNLDKLEHLYGVWCWNTGLRGSEKAAVWRIIKAQILDVKATAKSPDQEA